MRQAYDYWQNQPGSYRGAPPTQPAAAYGGALLQRARCYRASEDATAAPRRDSVRRGRPGKDPRPIANSREGARDAARTAGAPERHPKKGVTTRTPWGKAGAGPQEWKLTGGTMPLVHETRTGRARTGERHVAPGAAQAAAGAGAGVAAGLPAQRVDGPPNKC